MPKAKAALDLDDLGILRGYGVFDFLRTYHGQPFLLKEHLARLRQSAKVLNIKVPISEKKINTIIKRLLQKNNYKDSNVRIVVTGGKLSHSGHLQSASLFILIEPLKPWPRSLYAHGIKVVTFEYQKDMAQAKSLNYAMTYRLQDWRRKQKAFEILYTYQGKILEASSSNFFIIKNKTLITPKDNVLLGVTRNKLLKLAKNKFKVLEKNITFQDLKTADEAFITATNKEIMPVVKVDNIKIGSGRVGQHTKQVMALFQDYIDSIK